METRHFPFKNLRFISLLVIISLIFGVYMPASAIEGTGILGISELIPIGHTTGIKIYTDGVVVTGLQSITTVDGQSSPAFSAGILEGDILTHVGSEKLTDSDSLTNAIQDADDGSVTVRFLRNGEPMQVEVTPAQAAIDSRYRIGVWVRDSMAGIGTITFYDPNSGQFGALGHGVNDVDTGKIMPLLSGTLMYSQVESIKKGESGSPGELRGKFDDKQSGTISQNTANGIFGTLENTEYIKSFEAVPVAKSSEVKNGKARVRCNIVGDEIREYDIEITKVYPRSNNASKGMSIKITDPELLKATNGIVQGMSGSPILQNGKLIGAVTHVFVNDSQKGYAVFIENMIEEMYGTRGGKS